MHGLPDRIFKMEPVAFFCLIKAINVMSGRKKLDKKDKFNYLGFEFIIIYFVMLYTCTDGLST